MNSTKDEFFLDTNIIVYIFDKDNPQKRNISIKLIKEALENGNGIVSFQVIQEFCNVALRKFKQPLLTSDCKYFINRFLYPICDVFPGLELYDRALNIHENTGFSFYDSLIIASAVCAKCKFLYSEDLQDGSEINGVKIVNPFANYD